MTKAKALLVLAFIVVCAAGVVVGTAVDRHARPPEPPRGPFPGLDLTSEQQAALAKAWDPVRIYRGEMFHKRHEYDDQRWAAIQALFTKDQKDQFDQIQANYKKQTKELDAQLSARVDSAIEQMKAILTPEQFRKWNDMRKDHDHGPGHEMGRPGMGPPGMGGPGIGGPPHGRRGDRRHSTTPPATDPAAEPSP